MRNWHWHRHRHWHRHPYNINKWRDYTCLSREFLAKTWHFFIQYYGKKYASYCPYFYVMVTVSNTRVLNSYYQEFRILPLFFPPGATWKRGCSKTMSKGRNGCKIWGSIMSHCFVATGNPNVIKLGELLAGKLCVSFSSNFAVICWSVSNSDLLAHPRSKNL